MQISFQTFIRKHSHLGIWYHIHGRLPVISFSLASIPQGGARGKNLGHLFFLLKNHLYLKNIYYFIFWLSVTSGLLFRTFEQKTARALAKKLLLTEFPPEPLTQKQLNVTDLYPMVSSTNFAQKVPLHWTMDLPKLQIRNVLQWLLLLNQWSKIYNNFTELSLTMHSTKIIQLLWLCH